jgi:hypothetical protein
MRRRPPAVHDRAFFLCNHISRTQWKLGRPTVGRPLFSEFPISQGKQMKPNHKVESAKWLSHYDDPNRRGDSFPCIAFEYQPRQDGGSTFGGGAPAPRPGFSRLANEVLRSDASRSFGVETAVLGLVTLASAWPIALMIREVIRLLK